jgi:hypothetical protein
VSSADSEYQNPPYIPGTAKQTWRRRIPSPALVLESQLLHSASDIRETIPNHFMEMALDRDQQSRIDPTNGHGFECREQLLVPAFTSDIDRKFVLCGSQRSPSAQLY